MRFWLYTIACLLLAAPRATAAEEVFAVQELGRQRQLVLAADQAIEGLALFPHLAQAVAVPDGIRLEPLRATGLQTRRSCHWACKHSAGHSARGGESGR